MEHQNEHPHAFVKNGRVVNVAVFAEHDQELIERVRVEQDADEAVCCCDNQYVPSLHWSWDGSSFEAATPEYLYSVGVLENPPTPAE